MLARGLTSAVGCLLLAMIGTPVIAEEQYCDLAAPPANAVVEANHGSYFFIFPDALPDKFTGCKTWWIDTGQKYLVFRLKDGRVTEVTSPRRTRTPTSGEPQYTTCLYPNAALAKDSPPDDCLSFEDAQSFANHSVGTEPGPNVPSSKDIRTKAPL